MRAYDLTQDPRTGIISALKYLHAEAWNTGDLVACDKITEVIEHMEAPVLFMESEQQKGINL